MGDDLAWDTGPACSQNNALTVPFVLKAEPTISKGRIVFSTIKAFFPGFSKSSVKVEFDPVRGTVKQYTLDNETSPTETQPKMLYLHVEAISPQRYLLS